MSDEENMELMGIAEHEADADGQLILDKEVVYPEPIGEEELQEIIEIEENSRSLPEPPRADVNLEVPFVHQLWDTPDWYNGHWGCGPTSATMVLAYYGLLQAKPMMVSWPFRHESEYGWYLGNDFSANGRKFNISAKTPDGWAKGFYGTAVANVTNIGWCAVAQMGRRGMVPLMNTFLTTINKRVRSIQPSERVAKATIDKGNPVIVSGRPFTLNGHLMVIRGYYYDRRRRATAWIMNDPYGYRSTGHRQYDGGNIVYWWDEIEPKYMYVIA